MESSLYYHFFHLLPQTKILLKKKEKKEQLRGWWLCLAGTGFKILRENPWLQITWLMQFEEETGFSLSEEGSGHQWVRGCSIPEMERITEPANLGVRQENTLQNIYIYAEYTAKCCRGPGWWLPDSWSTLNSQLCNGPHGHLPAWAFQIILA